MIRLLRFLFYSVIVKSVVMIVLGLNVRNRQRLPQKGPAIIVANHNSHLDTMVLISLLPSKLLPLVRPVAAMDYFFRSRMLAWFALNIVGILPIKRIRSRNEENPLSPCFEALEAGKILILFPEGSRGEPERLAEFKGGIARLAERFPAMPVTLVYLHGLGKALPKGEALLVPFFCDVFVGEAIPWTGDRRSYMRQLDERMAALSAEGRFPIWA